MTKVIQDIETLLGDDSVIGPKWYEAWNRLRFLVASARAILPTPDEWAAHPDAQWWAVDAVGNTFWGYGSEPEIRNSWWDADDADESRVIDLPIGFDWRDTLTKRPEGV